MNAQGAANVGCGRLDAVEDTRCDAEARGKRSSATGSPVGDTGRLSSNGGSKSEENEFGVENHFS